MCEEQLDCLLLAAGASCALLDGLDQRDVVALKSVQICILFSARKNGKP